jgi:hypothetical protein
LVLLDHKVVEVQLVLKVQKVMLDHKVEQDYKDHKVVEVQQALRVQQDP